MCPARASRGAFSLSQFLFSYFPAIYRHMAGSVYAKPYGAAPDIDDSHYDIVTDQNVLVYFPGEYEH